MNNTLLYDMEYSIPIPRGKSGIEWNLEYSMWNGPETVDMLTTARRILFFFTELSGRRALFRDSGQVDDGQTSSVLFD